MRRPAFEGSDCFKGTSSHVIILQSVVTWSGDRYGIRGVQGERFIWRPCHERALCISSIGPSIFVSCSEGKEGGSPLHLVAVCVFDNRHENGCWSIEFCAFAIGPKGGPTSIERHRIFCVGPPVRKAIQRRRVAARICTRVFGPKTGDYKACDKEKLDRSTHYPSALKSVYRWKRSDLRKCKPEGSLGISTSLRRACSKHFKKILRKPALKLVQSKTCSCVV